MRESSSRTERRNEWTLYWYETRGVRVLISLSMCVYEDEMGISHGSGLGAYHGIGAAHPGYGVWMLGKTPVATQVISAHGIFLLALFLIQFVKDAPHHTTMMSEQENQD